MLPPCLLLGSPLCAGYRLHLLSIHSPSSELFLALLRHPDVCLMWRSSVLHPPGCRSFMPHPPAARPFPLWHIRLAVMSKGLSFGVFFYRYFLQPRVQHSPCTSDLTAKANPSINPMFLVLCSLSLTSIYLHSKAPGELSDLKRLESARKDEFPFTTGRLRK